MKYKIRLSLAARQDLIAIARYGDEKFGRQQSDAYRAKFEQRFAVLQAQPYLYQAVDHIRPGYRRSVCGAHSIYYRVVDDRIDVIRVLGRQDLEDSL